MGGVLTLLISVRPEPGGAVTLAAARRSGHRALGFPLFAVQPVGWDGPPPATVDALLIGSANALRHGGGALDRYRGKPVYVVGTATARAAQDGGLAIMAIGRGGMQTLFAALAPGHRRLLRLTGRARVPLMPPAGVTIIERIVYDSAPLPLPHDLARLLATRALAGTVVLLHSAEAARHFAAECDRLRVVRARVRLAALGPRIAAAAGTGWMATVSAATPDDAALLALATQLCQTSPMPTREQSPHA